MALPKEAKRSSKSSRIVLFDPEKETGGSIEASHATIITVAYSRLHQGERLTGELSLHRGGEDPSTLYLVGSIAREESTHCFDLYLGPQDTLMIPDLNIVSTNPPMEGNLFPGRFTLRIEGIRAN